MPLGGVVPQGEDLGRAQPCLAERGRLLVVLPVPDRDLLGSIEPG